MRSIRMAVPYSITGVDVEGVANVIETYTEARAVAPGNAFAGQAQGDIEAETGGTLEQNPQPYLDRCVVCQPRRRIERSPASCPRMARQG
jgi:hypothetical protein